MGYRYVFFVILAFNNIIEASHKSLCNGKQSRPDVVVQSAPRRNFVYLYVVTAFKHQEYLIAADMIQDASLDGRLTPKIAEEIGIELNAHYLDAIKRKNKDAAIANILDAIHYTVRPQLNMSKLQSDYNKACKIGAHPNLLSALEAKIITNGQLIDLYSYRNIN